MLHKILDELLVRTSLEFVSGERFDFIDDEQRSLTVLASALDVDKPFIARQFVFRSMQPAVVLLGAQYLIDLYAARDKKDIGYLQMNERLIVAKTQVICALPEDQQTDAAEQLLAESLDALKTASLNISNDDTSAEKYIKAGLHLQLMRLALIAKDPELIVVFSKLLCKGIADAELSSLDENAPVYALAPMSVQDGVKDVLVTYNNHLDELIGLNESSHKDICDLFLHRSMQEIRAVSIRSLVGRLYFRALTLSFMLAYVKSSIVLQADARVSQLLLAVDKELRENFFGAANDPLKELIEHLRVA
jgi:hypothetical protein